MMMAAAEGGGEQLLVLDDKIRDWVLIPIVVVMFIVAIVKHNITVFLKSDRKPELKNVKTTQTLLRTKRLRANANLLPAASFHARKAFFNHPEEGLFAHAGEGDSNNANPLSNPMMDPSNMVDMLKRNMAMVIPQLILVAWVNYFFSGFVLVKIPFPLTLPFRGMLQRGIELSSLDVTYVSSLSWYFLALFGLRGINSLVLGEQNEADDAKMMQEQMQMGGGGAMMQQPDTGKLFKAEKENLELVEHHWMLDDVEKRLLQRASSSSTNKSF